eukprot:469066-Amphidinium_carterae.1
MLRHGWRHLGKRLIGWASGAPRIDCMAQGRYLKIHILKGRPSETRKPRDGQNGDPNPTTCKETLNKSYDE